MVIRDSESARSIGRSGRGTISERQHSRHFLAAQFFYHPVRSFLGRLEVRGNGLIAPGIFQFVAAIGDVNELDAQFARRFLKAPRLVAQFRREEQQAFGGVIGCQTRSFEERSEEHTSELQSPYDLVCRLLLEKKKQTYSG